MSSRAKSAGFIRDQGGPLKTQAGYRVHVPASSYDLSQLLYKFVATINSYTNVTGALAVYKLFNYITLT